MQSTPHPSTVPTTGAPALEPPITTRTITTRRITTRPAALSLPLLVISLRLGLLASAAAGCIALGRADGIGTSASLLWLNLAIVGVDLICLMALASVLRRREGTSLRILLATRSPSRDALIGLGLLVVITVSFFAATFVGNLVAYHGPPPSGGAVPHVPLVLGLVSLLVMPATVAVAEEAVYRAYALPRLADRFGAVGATVGSALFFGLQHVVFALGDPRQMVARFVTTFLAGLVFGALWFRVRRIWPLIIAHWLLDVLFLGLPMLALALGVGR